ncbi:MAG: hypothetical protein ACXWNQ_00105 [Anaerolineales bacterium]
MGWKSWKLSDWNKALINAVFLDKERLAMRITRIPASPAFLAECTGDPAADHRAAIRAFITSFGKYDWQIRDHFAWQSPLLLKKQTQLDGYPPIFAALYLTLLAATADENTFDEGNFRNRFVELLSPVVSMSSAPNFDFLSTMWEHVKAWSEARAKEAGDCRVLVLPQRYHEKLIGYSKRLAFPAFRDERRLQDLLQERGLGRDSNFPAVSSAVAWRENMFSQPFKEEYDLFRRLVAEGRYQDAYDSPFWGAVQAITWEQDKTASAEVGTFIFGADASDPNRPEFYLLTDEAGKRTLGPSAVFRNLGSRSPGMYAVLPPQSSSWTPPLLAVLAEKKPRLTKTPLWRRIDAGCIALYRDMQGNLSLDGEHFDEGPACFLVEGSYGEHLAATAKTFSLKMTELRTDDSFGTWKVLLFESLSTAALERLALDLPDLLRSALVPAWRPPRVGCTGGAWYGQSLLLNPASSPMFAMAEAVRGSYEVYDRRGQVDASGELDEAGIGYQIPPSALACLTEPASLSVQLQTADGMSSTASYALVQHVPIGRPAPLADVQAWLSDGRDGMVQSLDCPPAPGGVPKPRDSSAMPRFLRNVEASAPSVGPVDLKDVPQPLGWLGETLSLRFQRRTTLPFSDLQGHLAPAAAAAAEARHWHVKRVLLSSGWLMRVQRATSPFTVVAPAPAAIALRSDEGDAVARVCGMFSRSELARLAGALAEGESAHRIGGPDAFGVGAIELRLTSADRMPQLANEFGLEVLFQAEFGLPLQTPRQLLRDGALATPKLPARDLEIWDPIKHNWVSSPEQPKQVAPGSILRFRGAQRYMYWIAGAGGYRFTDSSSWAFILSLAAAGRAIGEIATQGQCVFSPAIDCLPLPLVQWWMLWGGGFVGVKPCGSLYLGGDGGGCLWTELKDWLPQQAMPQARSNIGPVALQRRALALRLRLSGHSTYNYKE